MTDVSIDDLKNFYNQKGNIVKKLENKLSIRYPFIVLIFVLSLYGSGFLISVWIDKVIPFLNSWIFLAGSFCLCIAAISILYFESSYFSKLLELRSFFDVSDETYYVWLKSIVAIIYKPFFYILFGLPILAIGVQSIINFCLTRPSEFWPGITVELMSSDLFIGYLFLWSIIVMLILGFVIYVAIVVCYKAVKIFVRLPMFFNFFHPDGVFGLSSVLNYFLRLMALYFFVASVGSAVFLTKPDFGTYCFIVGISLPGIGFFMIFYSIHKSLALSKKILLSQIETVCRPLVKSPIPSGDNSKIQVILLLFREIMDKSDWPINISFYTKSIGLFLSPTISFLLKIGLPEIFKLLPF